MREYSVKKVGGCAVCLRLTDMMSADVVTLSANVIVCPETTSNEGEGNERLVLSVD